MSDQSAFGAALLDPERSLPGGLVSWNGSDPAARFAVYRNNVIASLIEALVDTYPVTRALVGGRFFGAMARQFIAAEPPASPIMSAYGEALPAFIDGFAPASGVPYLADVARLEWLRVRAFHAADAEPLDHAVFVDLMADADRLPGLGLRLHPSLQLFASDFAVLSLWAAHEGALRLEEVDPYRPERMLLVRPRLEVDLIPLDEPIFRFVELLHDGVCLGAALERIQAQAASFDLVAALGLLIGAGIVVALIPEGARHGNEN